MKIIITCLTLLAAVLPAPAQDAAKPAAPAVNSFFERGPVKEYAPGSVYVGGEVENPGPVALASLPVRETAVKEVALAGDKAEFKGAYFFSGYSLYDILKAKPVKKVNADFSPEVDLYVVVENAKGEKAVFSWGEIYYARDNFRALIYKTARSVTAPKKGKDWPLPETSRLVCAGDLYNTRFLSDPVKITVKSAAGAFPGEKHAAAFAPEFTLTAGGKSVVVKDLAKLAAKRGYLDAGYGHGTGFKGIKRPDGYLLKDILAQAGVAQQDAKSALVVISAPDSYRAVFSLAEIINRGDNADFLVVDRGQDEEGRFSLFAAPDFFVDRNVRSMAKVEVIKL